MNEDVFNISLRKFLRKVGISGQRSRRLTLADIFMYDPFMAKPPTKLHGVELDPENAGYSRSR